MNKKVQSFDLPIVLKTQKERKNMQFSVEKVYPQYHFTITGASYGGAPRDGTMLYITAKVAYLVEHLKGHRNCLCFVEKGIHVPEEIGRDNGIIYSENPAYTYAVFAMKAAREMQEEERKKGYKLQPGGYYTGENVRIGADAYIEPNVLIGHDVQIGKNAVILAGSVIKHAVIGDFFLCRENAVVGDYSFTIAGDDQGNNFRIPSMGRVLMGDHVEIGAGSDVAMGACGDTVIEDYVKVDALAYIGHEAYVHKNTEIMAGVMTAGFVELSENSCLGMNSSVRNRIVLGQSCMVGMGAVVTRAVGQGVTVAGNPARELALPGGYWLSRYPVCCTRCVA